MLTTRDYIVGIVDDKISLNDHLLHDTQSPTKHPNGSLKSLNGTLTFIPNGSLTPTKRVIYEFHSDYWFFKDPNNTAIKYVAYFSWRDMADVKNLIDNIVSYLKS